jgi:peptidoglycan/LPS O-acetylase OafA/YrhL
MTPNYRPDIDGLRAIAVLSVLFFHSGFFEVFSGGYVDVDIFFVISGFLIARIIVREIGENKFSFTTFYKRCL